VWRIPTGGGQETTVVDSVSCFDYAVGEPGIYFFSVPDRKGHSSIDVYEFSTGETRKILTIEQRPMSIAVSPDGRAILYTVAEGGSDLMLVENFR